MAAKGTESLKPNWFAEEVFLTELTVREAAKYPLLLVAIADSKFVDFFVYLA